VRKSWLILKRCSRRRACMEVRKNEGKDVMVEDFNGNA
jgi:hypothetical protein